MKAHTPSSRTRGLSFSVYSPSRPLLVIGLLFHSEPYRRYYSERSGNCSIYYGEEQ